MTFKDIWPALVEGVRTYAPIMFILAASIAFSRVLTLMQIPQMVSTWIPSDRGNGHGYNTGNLDPDTDPSADRNSSRHESDPLWNHDGCQPCNRICNTADRSQSVCGKLAYRYPDHAHFQTCDADDRLLPCCTFVNYIYPGDQPGTDIGGSSMKKAVRMTVAAGMCAALALSAGCQKKTVADDEVQRYAWPLATASPEDTVTQIYAEKFAEEVEKLSDGKMKIQVYPNGTIGGDRELLESCKDGDIPFVIQNTAPQVTFMPDLAVFDIPCRFSTIDEVREKVDDPEFYEILEDVYENGGYKLLGYADQGFRVMSTNKMVESLADFKGQKIRTMENSYHMDFWKKLKASPTPMSFSEVYIGLQQGTIDAQENPYEVIVSNKLYEQQDYVVETNHLPHLISLIVSDEFFQDLPEDKQTILVEAAEIAKEEARQASDDRIADKIKVIEDSGTQIVTLSDELRAEIREAVQPVYDEIEKNVDKKLYNAYMK